MSYPRASGPVRRNHSRRASRTASVSSGKSSAETMWIVQRITHACTTRPASRASVSAARWKPASRDHSAT
jgi:hypothetical protein